MGTLFPNYSSGAGATQATSAFGQQGPLFSAAGQGVGALGTYEQYAYQAKLSSQNAAILRQNAASDLAAGSYEESASKLRTGQLVGAERAAQGANNIDVNVGSTVATRASTQTVGAMDAAMIHYNAARAAYNENVSASREQAQAGLYKSAGVNALLSVPGQISSTLLGGASSLGSKWAQFQLSGASAGG